MTGTVEQERGPLHRHRDGDNLWYVHPRTGERFISCSSVLDGREKKALSDRWKPGQAAKAAFEQLPRVVAASRIKPCGRTNNRCDHDFRVWCADCGCGDCKDCMVKWLTFRHMAESSRRADEGTAMHDWAEDWILSGGKHGPILKPEHEPYIQQFLAFINDFGLTPDSFEMCEATVLNRAARWKDKSAGWGGTLDAQVRFDATATPKAMKLCRKFGKRRPLVTLDWKSREKEDAQFYSENALQLSAYHRGEVILFDDGREEPLPPTDGAVVVQIRPEGYAWRRADVSDLTYEAFLDTMRSSLWEIFHGNASTQVKTFPDLDIPDLPEPEAKPRRVRKTTAAPRNRIKAPAGTVPVPDARTVAERIGAVVGAGAPHPDSPYGDEIPF